MERSLGPTPRGLHIKDLESLVGKLRVTCVITYVKPINVRIANTGSTRESSPKWDSCPHGEICHSL